MAYPICLLALRNTFSQMLYLELCSLYGAVSFVERERDVTPESLLVVDLDAFPAPPAALRAVGYTALEHPDAVLRRPFSMAAFREAVAPPQEELLLAADGRSLVFRGRGIRLTEREALLFRALVEARGEVVSREALASLLVGVKPGEVAVYIHHLRQKLEADGRRAIASVRGGGYALIGGGAC